MGDYHSYEDEFAHADQRERELQRQMGMGDSAGYSPQQNYSGYNGNNYTGYGNYSNMPPQGQMYNAGQVPFDDGSPFDSSPDARYNVQGYGVYNEIYTDKYGNPIKPRAARKILVGFAVVFFTIGAILFTFMICVVHSLRASYARCTFETQAVVIDNIKQKRSTDNGTEDVYYPVLRYEYNSHTYEQKSDLGSDHQEFSIGDRTTIHLNPNDPKEFYTEKEDSFIFFTLLFLSGVFFLLGVMMVIVIVKSKKNEQARLQ